MSGKGNDKKKKDEEFGKVKDEPKSKKEAQGAQAQSKKGEIFQKTSQAQAADLNVSSAETFQYYRDVKKSRAKEERVKYEPEEYDFGAQASRYSKPPDDCDDLVDSLDRGVFLDDSQRVSPCVKSTAQMKHLRALDIDSTEIYLDEIPGIGEKAADALEDLGIRTVKQLISMYKELGETEFRTWLEGIKVGRTKMRSNCARNCKQFIKESLDQDARR